MTQESGNTRKSKSIITGNKGREKHQTFIFKKKSKGNYIKHLETTFKKELRKLI